MLARDQSIDRTAGSFFRAANPQSDYVRRRSTT